jgi:hypothetical protein
MAIDLVLATPVAQHLLRHAQRLGQLTRRPARAQHGQRLAAELIGYGGRVFGTMNTILRP